MSEWDFGQLGGFFGATAHAAKELGSDYGLSLYVAPAWSFDKDGIGSSGVTVTATAGQEPSEGWSKDMNLAFNFTDQGGFAAVTSPDLTNQLTWSLLASMGHGASDHLSGYSCEGYGAFSTGDIHPDAGETIAGRAWRVGAGVGYQGNFGGTRNGMNAWALYGGAQWEWADIGATQTASSPSLAVNFSVGGIRPLARGH